MGATAPIYAILEGHMWDICLAVFIIYLVLCTTWLVYDKYWREVLPSDKNVHFTLKEELLIYYVAPAFVAILSPISWLDQKRNEKEWYEEYLNTGKLFWPYVESKYLKRSKEIESELLSLAKSAAFLARDRRISLTLADDATESLFSCMLTTSERYEFVRVSPNVVMYYNTRSLFVVTFHDKCQEFEVSYSKRIMRDFPIEKIVDSYKERHMWTD